MKLAGRHATIVLVASLALGAAADANGQSPLAPSVESPTSSAVASVTTAYDRLFHGDKRGAWQVVDTLRQQRPGDLRIRFAWLLVARDRLEIEPAGAASFESALDALIDLAGRRYARSHQDAEALLMLANAHLMRSEYRLDHDKGIWGAARDGANAKSYIESYLKVYPNDGDALLVLGTYNYFADIVPTFFKVLRTLLFVPAGDRSAGLRQIERAAVEAGTLAPMAQRMLVDIYGTFEGRGDDAVSTAQRLVQRFPEADDAAFALAEAYASPAREDHRRAAAAYAVVAERRRGDTTDEGTFSRYRAIISQAVELAESWRMEEAVAMLSPTIDAQPASPQWVMPQYLLLRSRLLALLADDDAEGDARRIQDDARWSASRPAARELLSWMAARRASGEAARYAALIPANRLVADGQYDDARVLYEQVRHVFPDSPHLKYRMAYLAFVAGASDEALPGFTEVAETRTAPDPLRAMALVFAARVHDLASRRQQAIKTYERVIDKYEDDRAASYARIGLITAYKRRT